MHLLLLTTPNSFCYRIQEVEDPNYDPATAHVLYTKGSKSAPNSPKPKKEKEKRKDYGREVVTVRHQNFSSHRKFIYLRSIC